MATIPRTYLTTSKTGLSSIPLKNGQVISIWDNDEVWYDAPKNGARDGVPVRRKISGVRIVSTLPSEPMTDIVYVYLGSAETLPDGSPLYELRVWINDDWLIVGSNKDDANVKTEVSDGKFYLVGSDTTDTTISTLLKNSAVYVQNGVIYGDLQGTASNATEANHAAEATLATYADNDNASTPKPITSYLNDVTSDYSSNLGTTITFTLGDGTTKDVYTTDTVYQVYTASVAGLVNGTNTQVLTDTSGLILSGDGWIDIDNITLPSADHANSADADGENQSIADTYIKGLSFNTSTRDLTITYGDGDTDTENIPDTTYTVFTTTTDGLVPAASGSGDTSKFLRGDHTWQSLSVNDYQGATPSAPGVHGLVPAASAGETDKYLRSDGTWQATSVIAPDYQGATISTAGVHGLVPAASSGYTESYLGSDGAWHGNFTDVAPGLVPPSGTTDPTYSLKADGTWSVCDDTKNTAGAGNDISHKLFLVGAQSQSSEAQTYSNINVYVDSNKLYSNSVEVVNLSDSQALTNKSYEGYTLGSACAKSAASLVIPDDNLPTNNAIISYTNTRINQVRTLINYKLDSDAVAPTYNATIQDAFVGDGTTTTFALTESCSGISEVTVGGEPVSSGYSYDSGTNSIVFTTAPASASNIVVSYTQPYTVGDYCIYDDGNGMRLYRCITAITTAEAFDSNKWVKLTVSECLGKWISGTLTAGSTSITLSDASITSDSHIEVWAENGNVNYTSITPTTGSVTITFLAQASNMKVEIKVF